MSLHERCAYRITEWSPTLVPALLQTNDYARALSALDGDTAEQTGELIEARVERAKAVQRVPYIGFLGEEALRTRCT